MTVLPLTSITLLRIMPRAEQVIGLWVGPLEQSMLAFKIDTRARAAMFLANIAHESVELTELEENLRYRSAERLRAVFPRHFLSTLDAERYVRAGPEAIANKVYANRLGNGSELSGDGWRYRARGPIGLTFKANYAACSQAICGDSETLVHNPELVMDPEFGAASAAWFWDQARCSESADKDDFDGVCDRINIGRKTLAIGDSNGYKSRLEYLEAALRALP